MPKPAPPKPRRGRPPSQHHNKVYFRLSDELKTWLIEMSARTGTDMSNLAHRIIADAKADRWTLAKSIARQERRP